MATYSSAVQAARERRIAGAGERAIRWEWFLSNVVEKINLTMKQRVSLATEMLKDKILRNISVAVGKEVRSYLTKRATIKNRTVVTERSKPGEFPRADTTRLMLDVGNCSDVMQEVGGTWMGWVGTSLSYGVILETRMGRSFLVRTLREEESNIQRILTESLIE